MGFERPLTPVVAIRPHGSIVKQDPPIGEAQPGLRPRAQDPGSQPASALQTLARTAGRLGGRSSYPAPPDGYALLEALPGAALVLDPEGIVRFINRIAADRIDRTPEDCLGRDFFREVLPELEGLGAGERFRAAMSRHPSSLAWDAGIQHDNGERTLRFGARSLQEAGGRIAVVLIEDRSAAVREAERRKHLERLAALGELSSGAAHEINNPLAAIKGFAQLLCREVEDAQHRQALEIISDESSRISRVIDHLLDFGAEQRRSEPEPVNLTELAESILTIKRYGFESSGVHVEIDLDPEISPVHGERGALQRMILILLNHSERSLLALSSDRRLRVCTREVNDGVVLYVGDNGPGVPRQALRELIDTDPQPPDRLGLYSAEAVVREHHGSLSAESAPGRGTTYRVHLPRLTDSRPREEPVEHRPSTRPALRVLVADDEPTLRIALAMFLGRQGYEVEMAATADEAYRMAIRGHFDVAMVDARMPGDGLVLIRRLADEPGWTGRTILMTGDHTIARLTQQFSGDLPHLVKPFDMMDAVRLIESIADASSE